MWGKAEREKREREKERKKKAEFPLFLFCCAVVCCEHVIRLEMSLVQTVALGRCGIVVDRCCGLCVTACGGEVFSRFGLTGPCQCARWISNIYTVAPPFELFISSY